MIITLIIISRFQSQLFIDVMAHLHRTPLAYQNFYSFSLLFLKTLFFLTFVVHGMFSYIHEIVLNLSPFPKLLLFTLKKKWSCIASLFLV